MNIRYLVMLAASLIFTGNAFAEDGAALAKKSNCTTCHAVDKKLVGPAFKEVAAKYKDDKGAQATLEKKVRSGGSGNWGPMPMPATAKSASDDDIKTLVQWVLSLK
jgi:cytochrome c